MDIVGTALIASAKWQVNTPAIHKPSKIIVMENNFHIGINTIWTHSLLPFAIHV